MVGNLLPAKHEKFSYSVQTGDEAPEEPLVTAQNGGCFRSRYFGDRSEIAPRYGFMV